MVSIQVLFLFLIIIWLMLILVIVLRNSVYPCSKKCLCWNFFKFFLKAILTALHDRKIQVLICSVILSHGYTYWFLFTELVMSVSCVRDKSRTLVQNLKAGSRDLKLRNQCKIDNVVYFVYLSGYFWNLNNNYCVHLSAFLVVLLISIII